ncbi:MAG TPA: type IV pilus secretin PilQ [Candidatus Acidoferrum sp.]|nr:type IV pilus secretin PilQ [Candidatus Acidoferrum sp.]
MRIIRRGWGLAAGLALGLMLTGGAAMAADSPVVHVKATVKDGGVVLVAQANGPFDYTTYRPSESLFVVDLTGVSSGDTAGARIVDSDLVKGYRLLTYEEGQKPVVRVEVLLASGVQPRVDRTDNAELTLLVGKPLATPVEKTPVSPASPSGAQPTTAAEMKTVSARPEGTRAEGIGAIESVSLKDDSGTTEVSVMGNGPLAYHALRLHNPDRLVLDFSGTHLRASTRQIASNLDPVREVRLAQFTPEVSRVVIDLRQPSAYTINANGSQVTVGFAPSAAASGPAKAAPTEAVPAEQTTKFVAPTPAPSATPSVQTASYKPASSSPQVAAPATMLPANLTQSSAALASPATATAGTAVQEMSPATARQVTAGVASSLGSASSSSTGAAGATTFASGAGTSGFSVAGGAEAPTHYTGEPISVNLKDVDLRDFFRLIHEISGLNVVVDPNVKGSLTIVLDDVPWDQALDIVLRNNDLEKQLDGNVLRIATKDTVKKEAEQDRDLAKAQAEAADVVTTTRVLSYAKSDDMINIVKKFLSSRGDVISDSRDNTLIIRDIPSVLPVIDNLLRQLDKKSQQVEIEARVVAANRNFSREVGTELGLSLGYSTTHNFNGISGDPTTGASPTTFTPAPPIIIGSGGSTTSGAQIPLLTNLGTSVPTSGFQYLFASPNAAVDFVINAAEDRGVGKLLSKPKVITQNNQKATVKQGTRIPVQTIINNTISVQYVDAVLELDVTPQITAEGTIFMDVDVKNDQIDQSIPRVQGIPAIDTQEANTKVLINDGGTVVIGGIIVSQQRTDIQQVPLFGSLPVIGNLFKHTTVNSQSQELLFFLTPRILPS